MELHSDKTLFRAAFMPLARAGGALRRRIDLTLKWEGQMHAEPTEPVLLSPLLDVGPDREQQKCLFLT